MEEMKRIYLDYAATTPVRKEVVKAMMPYFDVKFGNPGSLHSFGQEAMAAVDGARERIAQIFECDFRGVLFCGSATEANNLVIRSTVNNWKEEKKPRIIISVIEHESILETARVLEREGKIELILLSVDQEGIVSLKQLKQVLTKNTALVSIMYVNNEVGSMQPIQEIAKIISDFKKEIHSDFYPLFHTDAVQAFSYFNCSFETLRADAITTSAHKCGGPKGIGVLCFSSNISTTNKISPIITGGGQEFGYRSGTENVQNIVGCAESLSITEKNRKKESTRLELLRKKYIKNFLKLFPRSYLYGGAIHAPHIVNINLAELSREEFLTQADLLGVALSSGSACSARAHSASHVLSAMQKEEGDSINGVRASFGYGTTTKDIEETFKRLSVVFGKKK